MMYQLQGRDSTLVTVINNGDMVSNAQRVLVPSLQVVARAAGDT